MTASAGGTPAAAGAPASAAPDACPAGAPAAAAPDASPAVEPGDSASAVELRRLHAELGAYVPELHQVHQLLEASLSLGDDTEVAPMLRQRQRQCEVAALVLSSPLTVVSKLGGSSCEGSSLGGGRLHRPYRQLRGQQPALAC